MDMPATLSEAVAQMGLCRRCGTCCSRLIVEADAIDVIREPRIAERGKCMNGKGELSLDETVWSIWDIETRKCVFQQADNICEIYATRPRECVGFLPCSEKCMFGPDGDDSPCKPPF